MSKVKLTGVFLPSGRSIGTLCRKEQEQNSRLLPKYGSLLFLVDNVLIAGVLNEAGIPQEESFSVDRHSFDKTNSLGLQEERLILEMSVMYQVPPGTDPALGLSWESMLRFAPEAWLSQLSTNIFYELELPKESFFLPKDRKRSTRQNRDVRSYILKCYCANVARYSVLMSSSNLPSVSASPSFIRNKILGYEVHNVVTTRTTLYPVAYNS